jgi:hypothetical protein
MVANNCRFLILPDAHQPNLDTRVLSPPLDRLSSDWQAFFGHPILVVETFVDPERFQAMVHSAKGWFEFGPTQKQQRSDARLGKAMACRSWK